jgi:hypothetical protein
MTCVIMNPVWVGLIGVAGRDDTSQDRNRFIRVDL